MAVRKKNKQKCVLFIYGQGQERGQFLKCPLTNSTAFSFPI